MNRAIKFRAWDKTYKKFHYFELKGFEIIPKDNFDGFPLLNSREDFDLYQWTGLKDKNLKEIYEGDMVNYALDEAPRTIRVRWSDIQARFVMDKLHDGKWLDSFYNINEEVALDLEVIGNVYDTPPAPQEGEK